ncbi:MAG: hypothetical protein EXS36_03095 [Pedosphaera sp.]|nr:hypothetical protein [Pedosphaera sp.]
MSQPKQNNEVSKIVRWLRYLERHPFTPMFGVNFINFLRQSGDLERRFIKDPLRSIPELAGRISRGEQLRYGSESRSNQIIADALLLGIEYAASASVAGDVAEFGTMKGRTAQVLAAAMAAFRHKGRLHLFDSFEGLPESPSDRDRTSYHVQEGAWSEGACQGIGPKALRIKCKKFLPEDNIIIHQGWYSETVKKVADTISFGLVHVDCDLYQSTIEALDPLFARGMISEGALILFDDWNCNRSSRERGERRAWIECCEKHRIDYSDGGDYSWGGHKFIVHDYKSLEKDT